MAVRAREGQAGQERAGQSWTTKVAKARTGLDSQGLVGMAVVALRGSVWYGLEPTGKAWQGAFFGEKQGDRAHPAF